MFFNATGYAERSTLNLNKDKSFNNNVSQSFWTINILREFYEITKLFTQLRNLHLYYVGIHTKFW